MCGILGAFGKLNISKPQFEQALQTLNHRGPDEQGLFFDPICYLGHKRLSIIDLSSGQQPMASVDGNLTIVFNGEIYNYQSLKKEFNDYRFQTTSDTEVILAAYQKYQEKVVDHLEGMFAFAIYDKLNQKIFLARDPFGIKPLVYYLDDQKLIFASEIKAILPLINQKLELNKQSVYDFLAYKHIPAPFTIFHQINKLAAGHFLKIKYNNYNLQKNIPEKYWYSKYNPVDKDCPSQEIQEQILNSVKSHLIADVPVGAFLSGGLDSSTIVWAMKKLGFQPNTYTVGFSNLPNDQDIIYSRLLAKRLNTNHHELIINLDNYQAAFEKVAQSLDEPFADPALVSNYLVSQATAKLTKVVLSGDGGDEMFFGYNVYSKIKKINLLKFLKAPFESQGNFLLENYFHYKKSFLQKLLNDFDPLLTINLPEYKDTTLKLRMNDLNNTLPEYFLRKVDITSMLCSLEVRTPFVHRPLAEYILPIPIIYHYNNDIGKQILTNAVKNELPEQILNRPKQGFSRPINLLNTDENINFIKTQLNKFELFNQDVLQELLNNYQKNSYTKNLIWRLLIFSKWLHYS